jgi:hypothetical protein
VSKVTYTYRSFGEWPTHSGGFDSGAVAVALATPDALVYPVHSPVRDAVVRSDLRASGAIMTKIEDTEEYQQGAAARRQGEPQTSCPYPKGGGSKDTESRARWEQGWLQAGVDDSPE